MLRAFVIFCIALAAAIAPAAANGFETSFLIKRNGKAIGHHRVTAVEADDSFIVRTDIAMKVKLGPIPVFRYRHEAEERWRGGALEHAVAETDRNGRETYVRATREDDRLVVESTAYDGAVGPEVQTTSWWNRQVMEAYRLLSTQTGEVISVRVERLGETLAPGGLKAEQYRVAGSVDFDIWYDGDRWVGARFVIDGEELIYERVEKLAEYAGFSELAR